MLDYSCCDYRKIFQTGSWYRRENLRDWTCFWSPSLVSGARHLRLRGKIRTVVMTMTMMINYDYYSNIMIIMIAMMLRVIIIIIIIIIILIMKSTNCYNDNIIIKIIYNNSWFTIYQVHLVLYNNNKINNNNNNNNNNKYNCWLGNYYFGIKMFCHKCDIKIHKSQKLLLNAKCSNYYL